MILYYAIGGGLGHITRGQALLYTLQVPKQEALILSSPVPSEILHSLYYHTVPFPDDIQMDLVACSSWVQQMFMSCRPTTFFVDTFPLGLFGELVDLDNLRFVTDWQYVSRIFRFAKYLKINNLDIGACQRFSTAWFTEMLPSQDERLISSLAYVSKTIDLIDPPSDDAYDVEQLNYDDRYWLIVHSGSYDEVVNLLLYARRKQLLENGLRPTLLVATDRLVNDGDIKQYHPLVVHSGKYPALSLMEGAERLISACGANIMRQTREMADRHDFIPMERAFDDQFLRAGFRRL